MSVKQRLSASVDADLLEAGRAAVAAGNAGNVVDAALVLLAGDGDTILTSDPDDLEILAVAARADLEIVRM